MRRKSDERALECAEYFDALIAAFRYVAYRCGYAIATHGSMARDIDLVCCPWRDSAVSAASLIGHLRKVTLEVIGTAAPGRGPQPETKPCGRLGWSFYLTAGSDRDYRPYLDISVMPKVETKPKKRVRP